MKQAKTLQNTRFCLDHDCELEYQIYWNSEDKEHNQHNRISSLEALCQYIKENQKNVDDLRLFYDSNKQSTFFDEYKIKVLNYILQFFNEDYREQQEKFTYIEHILNTIEVIRNRDLEGIEKLDNFAFLHDLKKLYQSSEAIQQQNNQFQVEIKKIIPKIDDFQQKQPLKTDTQAYQKFQQQQNRIIKLLNQQKEEIKPKLEGNLKQDSKIQSQQGRRIIKIQEKEKEIKNMIPKIDNFQLDQSLNTDEQVQKNQQQEEIKSKIINSLENDKIQYQQSIIHGETETQTGSMLIEKELETKKLKALPNGQIQKFQYDNGDYYEGQFKDGLKNGQGEIIYKNKSNYKGQWLNDLKDGEGVMKLQDGLIYEGCYRKDKQDGYGKKTLTDGTIYIGQWQNSMKHGQDELVMLYGDKYKGNFKEDKKDEQGEISFGGQFYKGQFLNGQFHGKGELIDKNRDKYVGTFKKGLKIGQSEQTNFDGSVYKGQWQDDQKIGIGE